MTSLMTVLLRGFLRGRVSLKSASEGTASGNSLSAAGLSESCFLVRNTMSENEPGVWTLMRSCISFGDGEAGRLADSRSMLDFFAEGFVGIDSVGGWCGVDGAPTDSGGASGMRFALLSSRMDSNHHTLTRQDRPASSRTTTRRSDLSKKNLLYVGGIKQTVFCDDSRVRSHGDVAPTSETWRYG